MNTKKFTKTLVLTISTIFMMTCLFTENVHAFAVDKKVAADPGRLRGIPDMVSTAGENPEYFLLVTDLYSHEDEAYIYRSSDGGINWSQYKKYKSWRNPAITVPEVTKDYLYIAYVFGGQSIFVERINLSTNLRWAYMIEQDQNCEIYNPRIVTDDSSPGDYNVYVTYVKRESHSTTGSVMFSRSVNKGDYWSSPIEIGVGLADASTKPDIAYANNTLYTCWDLTAGNLGNGSTTRNIFFKRSRDHGENWENFEVLSVDSYDSDSPKVAAINDSVVVVYNNANRNGDIMYSYSDNRGDSWRKEHCIDCSLNEEKDPDIAVDLKDGYFHLAYWDDKSIKYLQITPDMTHWLGAEKVNTESHAPASSQGYGSEHSVTALSKEKVGVAWVGFVGGHTPSVYFNQSDWKDTDSDELNDGEDNCPTSNNPGQEDLDEDGEGDVCDVCTDTDNDGYGNPRFSNNTCDEDNCPDDSNPGQEDSDGDGIGDVCDNCPDDYDPSQRDFDLDGVGNACDNCEKTPNGPILGTCTLGPNKGNSCTSHLDCAPIGTKGFCAKNQNDTDDDGIGDVCDPVQENPCTTSDDCDDGNVCTEDICDVATGVCQNPDKANGTYCDDGLFCTKVDACNNGQCEGSVSTCSAGEVCNEMTDSCEPQGSCTLSSDCDDGNDCTDDACVNNVCVYTNNTVSCDDGWFCTEVDVCNSGVCEGSGSPCSAGEVCIEEDDICEQKGSCDISIDTATTDLKSGQPVQFTVNATGDCNDSDYEWSVVSTIQSQIDQNGNYTAGVNNKISKKATDVVKVVDRANDDITDEITVTVSWKCFLVKIYGEDSEEIRLMRNFRDSALSKTPEGRELIKLYYEFSPVILMALESDDELTQEVKTLVDGILPLIKSEAQ